MGTSGFDAVGPDSMSDHDPVDVTFPEKVHADFLRDRDGDVVVEELDGLTGDLAGVNLQASPCGLVAEAAAALDRVHADCELFALLVEHNAEGVVWENVVEELAAYASQVLDPWIRSGAIYIQLSRKFIGMPAWSAGRQRLVDDQTCREDVIAHTIIRALEKLRRGLREGTGWDPRKGLALNSYFINGCLTEFVCVFEKERQWWNTHQGAADYDEAIELIGFSASVLWGSRVVADPADIVTNRIVLLEHLAGLTADDRTALWAHLNGYSHAEIAHLLHVTSKAIERRLHRLRKHARLSVRNR